jgi:hypothetical protein
LDLQRCTIRRLNCCVERLHRGRTTELMSKGKIRQHTQQSTKLYKKIKIQLLSVQDKTAVMCLGYYNSDTEKLRMQTIRKFHPSI